MEELNVLQLFSYLLPAVVVGTVSFYFFKMHLQEENSRRKFILRQENQKSALPLKLQAYERMILFLERISMGKLLFRLKPSNNDKSQYEEFLITSIEQEFDHNLTQQIYLSNECWNVIKTAKNATIGIIRKTSKQESITTADEFREAILKALMEQSAPTDAAIEYVKKEVKIII